MSALVEVRRRCPWREERPQHSSRSQQNLPEQSTEGSRSKSQTGKGKGRTFQAERTASSGQGNGCHEDGEASQDKTGSCQEILTFYRR